MRAFIGHLMVFLCVCCLSFADLKAELLALQQSFPTMAKKLRSEIERYHRKKIPLSKRNLIIYHVNEQTQEKDSVDIGYNNIQIFLSAIRQHTKTNNPLFQQAFYIFNVAGGSTSEFAKYLPTHLPNVAHVDWPQKCGEKDTPLKTILQLGPAVYRNFTSLIVTSDRSRGPMVGVKDALWIDEFRQLLDHNHVGMVGSSFSCELFAHVQPHMYALRTEVLTAAIAMYNSEQRRQRNVNVMHYFQDGVSALTQRLGYRLASILYKKRGNQDVFGNKCLGTTNPSNALVTANSNPSTWCDLLPEEVVFVKWGGVPLRPPGTMCSSHIDKVLLQTADLAVQDPQMQLHIPETFHRGIMYELMRQYNMEQWRGRDIGQLVINGTRSVLYKQTGRFKQVVTGAQYASALANPQVYMEDTYAKLGPKICVFATVLPTHINDPAIRGGTIFTSVNLVSTIESMLRQTNPNWRLFLLVGNEDAKFKNSINNELDKYGDIRLKLLSGIQKGNRASHLDRMLHELDNSEECVYASLTTADTVYGSEVVHNLLRTSTGKAGIELEGEDLDVTAHTTAAAITSGAGGAAEEQGINAPKIVFVPYDSRTTAEYETVTRSSLRRTPSNWLDHCINFDAMFAANLMPYTIQPNVMQGRIDLSAVFFLRDAVMVEKIIFGKIGLPDSLAQDDTCEDCVNAYYVQYLVRVKHWTYTRLPIDGFKSVIFRNPSPTLCVAAGNVWFDFPEPKRTGCLSPEMLRRLQFNDNKERPSLDWKFTNSRFKTCIRLSEYGYANKDDIYFSR
mmetsp:Transcript_29274/g.58426  ORF Transcript_29274/g.58426 Transcript_29274/m.58426 type:complete len:787 (-) Transcript_29274:10-2370(-)